MPYLPLPRRRTGVTTAVTIGGERFVLTANTGDDGGLAEVFLRWGKPGQTQAGLMDLYATALTVALQHGVPLVDLVRQGVGLHFPPSGHTDDPDLPRARSVVDWAARRLALDWLPYEDRAATGIFSIGERVADAGDWLAAQDAHLPQAPARPQEVAAFHADLAGGLGSGPLR